MDSDDNKVYMKRLNPHSVDEEKEMSLFPPSNKLYDFIQGEFFKQCLSIDGTTEDGQNEIAQHYNEVEGLGCFPPQLVCPCPGHPHIYPPLF
jgi:hypothetical protein